MFTFEKLKEFFKNWGLSTRQFISLFIFTATLFIGLAYINVQDAEKIVENQILENSEVMLKRTNQLIDLYFENVKNSLFLVATRQKMIEGEINKKELTDFLYEYGRYNSNFLKTIYLINKDGQVYSSKQVQYEIVGNEHLAKIYRMTNNNYGSIIWTEPYYTSLSDKTVAFALPIKDNQNKPTGAVAIVETNLDYLTSKMAPWLVGKKQSFVIMSSSNKIVVFDRDSKLLPFQPKIHPPKLDDQLVNKLAEQPTGVQRLDFSDNKFVTVKSKKNSLGWRLVMVIDQDVFYLSLKKLYQNFYFAAYLWIGILLAGSLLFIYFFTSPIRNLVSQMDMVQDFNNLHSIPVEREDEIGRLAMSYNAMMKRINKLIDDVKNAERQQKEYELRMLQSQIGPHFLYNTLACIGSLARQRRVNEVRETIKSLVKLLSFSFDKREEMVTVKEEILNIKSYFNIEKMRYGDKIDLDVNISEEAYNCKIMKLSLQPLVENSIFHGLIPKIGKGRIEIKSKIKDDILSIYIRDNGIGMTREEYENLLTVKTDKIKDRFSNIGIYNVHERIQLKFGEDYGLNIASIKKVGTVVRLNIPVIPK